MEKTRLEKIKEQLEEKMSRAIVYAIENGAKVETNYAYGGVTVDGVIIVPGSKKIGTKHSVVLGLDAPEINKLFEPTEEDLKKRAEELRAQLNEIENKLKPNEQ